jgi:DNA invertase Pin-like site-specific DNA recombinase
MRRAITYYRVSTQRQGQSGLGLRLSERQSPGPLKLKVSTAAGEFTEVETGKGVDALDRRPQLAAALATARQQKCPVLVAKLDRLSREVAFIAGLYRLPSSSLVSSSRSGTEAGTQSDRAAHLWHILSLKKR